MFYPSYHAVSRWQERVNPKADYSQAGQEILGALARSTYEKTRRTGEKFFRLKELRFIVKEQTIVTIEEVYDGGYGCYGNYGGYGGGD